MYIEEEELSIYEVEDLYKKLVTQLKSDQIIIDMKNVKKIDMSVIQLFVSAQKSCLQFEKDFELQNVSDEVKLSLSMSACEFLLGGANG